MTKKHIALVFLTFLLAACSTPLPGGEGPGEVPQSGMRATTSALPTQAKPATVSTAIPTLTALPPTSVPPTETPTEAASTQRTSPIDGMPQVYVPAGAVRMGGLDVHADDRDELPAHDVSLDAFWIDQLEVTNAMYMLCVQAGACTPPEDWASDRRPSYFNNEEFKDYPVVHVTWEQAGTYCAWAERRLPTEAEWERAARGDDFRNYPWGDEPPSEAYANFNRLIKDTSRVGSYPAGASPFGALDMAGNVWEWVNDLYGTEYYKTSPEHNPTGPETSSTNLRVIRGGSFQDEWVDLRVSKRGAALGPAPEATFDVPDRDGEHSSKIGFRCVADD
jgi:formylglycine-generating enzyme required for sulfatase activity